jgi:hypothetical protein
MLIACRCAASFLERGSNLLNLECPSMAAVCQVLVSFSCMRRSFAIVWKACEKSKFLIFQLSCPIDLVRISLCVP